MPDSGDFPLSEAELVFLRELARARSKFLIVGVGAAVLQGADAVTQGLDLWFRSLGDPAIEKAARKAGGVLVTRSNPPMVAGQDLDRIDLVVRCQGLEAFDKEYAGAVTLRVTDFSVKLLPLDRVIVSKKAAGRLKDKAVLESLRAALVASRKR